MTQTTDSHPENWRAPWQYLPGRPESDAQEDTQAESRPEPSYPTQSTPTQASTEPPASQPAPQPAYTSHPLYSTFTSAPTQPVPVDVTPPQPPFGDEPGLKGREPRRPGWIGVGAVGVGAAVLSSLLTAGLVNHQNNQADTSSLTSSTGSQSAPVVSGSSVSPDWTAVAAAVEPSVVSVQIRAGNESAEGSGVILDKQGRVLTNNHVVADAAQSGDIMVVLADGSGYAAKVVGTDPQSDLAVIQIQNAPSGLKPATLGNSEAVKVGDPVMAVGNPLGLSDTATTGIISALNRPVTTSQAGGGGGGDENTNPFGQPQQSTSEPVVTNAIQTDAAINPGNSGGALVDAHGRVIGINSSIASLGSSDGGQAGSIGLGFAIPINEAKDVANQLISKGSVAHSWLGVQLSDDTVTLNGAQRDAAVIAEITSGAPAAKAGLQQGDAVIAVDGEPVNGADSLVAQIRERAPGTTVKLTVVRSGQTKVLSVELGTRPS
jgi:putative serine protease PepD